MVKSLCRFVVFSNFSGVVTNSLCIFFREFFTDKCRLSCNRKFSLRHEFDCALFLLVTRNDKVTGCMVAYTTPMGLLVD